MHTKAVFRAAQALSESGFHVLRFNFRGVGTSTGEWGEGVGERDDVRAALDWMEESHPGLPFLLGGFSFGSMVGLRVGVEDARVQALLGLGLAVRKWDFSFLEELEKPLLVVQGEEDEFGPGPEIERALVNVGPMLRLRRVDGSDHYFHDHFDELQGLIKEYFGSGPGAEPFPPREGSTDPKPGGGAGEASS